MSVPASNGPRITQGATCMCTSNTWRPVAFFLSLSTGCSNLLNLDDFNGAVLDEPDANLADADTADVGSQPDSRLSDAPDDATTDSNPTDAPSGDAADGGRSSDSSTPDAQTVDGTTTDQSADATPADAPEASDGATTDAKDAGVVMDWCAANSTSSTAFCRDFDDRKIYSYGFSSTNINLVPGGTAPSIVSSIWQSPPSSLLFVLPILPACKPDGGSACSEQVQLNVNVLAHSLIQVAFAMYLSNYDPNNVHDASLVRVAFNGGQWAATWDLQLKASTIFETIVPLDGGAANTIGHASVLPPLAEWVNVLFTVDTANTQVGIAFNGIPQSVAATASPAIQGSVEVTVGVNDFVGPTTPLSFYLDNIMVTTN